MRTSTALLITLTLIPTVLAAPSTDQRERPVYRNEPVGYWITRLSAKDWPTRLDGAHGLREAGPAAWPAVTALIAALDDKEPEVRLMVIDALGHIGPEADRALPSLATAFAAARGAERCQILIAMLRIDYCSSVTIKTLRAALRDDNDDVCAVALQCSTSVPDLDDKEILEAARAALARPKLRNDAMTLLQSLGREGRQSLFEVARGADAEAREFAVSTLAKGALGDDEATRLAELLAGLLSADDAGVRDLARTQLQELGPRARSAKVSLRKVMDDGEPAERLRAAATLWKVAPDESRAIAKAAGAILKADSKQWGDALALLAALGPAAEDAVPDVAEILVELESVNRVHYATACTVLCALGPKARAAVPALLKLTHRSPEAVEVLARIGTADERIVPALMKAVTGDAPYFYRNAVRALGTIGPAAKDALPLLLRELKEPGHGVLDVTAARYLICAALVSIGVPDDAVKTVGDAISELEPGEQSAVVECLLKPGAAVTPFLPLLAKLLDSSDDDDAAIAYYLLKKHQPKTVAARRKALLQGDNEPQYEGKTLSTWLTQLREPEPERRFGACTALTRMPCLWLVAPVLLEVMATDDNEQVREVCCSVLHHPMFGTTMLACGGTDAQFRDDFLQMALSPQAQCPFTKWDARVCGAWADRLLGDEDPATRIFAALGIIHLNSGRADECVVQVMRDHRDVRPLAARYFRIGERGRLTTADPPQDHIVFMQLTPILLEMIRDSDLDQRRQALLTLAAYGLPPDDFERFLPAVARVIRADEPEIRGLAAQVLGTGAERAFDPWWSDRNSAKLIPHDNRRERTRLLIAALGDPAVEVKLAATRSLAQLGTMAAPARNALRSALRDKSPSLRIAAAAALWAIEERRCARELVPVLRDGLKAPNPDDRTIALDRLKDIGPDAEAAFPEVVALMRSDKGQHHKLAAATLLKIVDDPARALPFLSECLRDPQRQGREFTLAEMNTIAPGLLTRCSVPELVEMLGSDAFAVTVYAAHALGELGYDAREAVIPLLRQLHKDPNMHRDLVAALARIMRTDPGGDDVAAFFVLQALDPHSDVFDHCLELIPLLRNHGDELLPCLLACQDHPGPDWLQAFEGLVLTKKSLPLLDDLLTRPDVRIQSEACAQLRKLGPAARASVTKLKALLQDDNESLVQAAALALLAIEERPSQEARQVLLDAGPGALASLFKEGTLSKKELELFREDFPCIVCDAMEAFDENHQNISATEVFALFAAFGDTAAIVLPEYLEFCQNDDNLLEVRGTQPGFRSYLQSQGKSAIGPLRSALHDPRPRVRMLALSWVQLLGAPAAELTRDVHEALIDRRGFDHFTVREADYLADAIDALMLLGLKKDHVKDLARLLDHNSSTVQAKAAQGLASLGANAKAALPALQRVPEDADTDVLVAVAVARARIDGNYDRAVQTLEHILCQFENDPQRRDLAAAALCRLGPKAKSAMPTFEKLARNPSPADRLLAAQAYFAITGDKQTAVSLCINILESNRLGEETLGLLAQMGDDARPAFALIAAQFGDRSVQTGDPDVDEFLKRVLASVKRSGPELPRPPRVTMGLVGRG